MNTTQKWLVGISSVVVGAILIQRNRNLSKTKLTLPIGTKDFYKKFYPDAKKSEIATGVPALFTLAQAALESGYGTHAPGFNYFGIKASKSWKGQTQLLKTWECGASGNPVKDGIKDKILQIFPPGSPSGACSNKYSYRVLGSFRKYNNAAEGFIDHANFLKQNKRYKPAFAYTNNLKQFTEAIAKAGYATVPGYAKELEKFESSLTA